MPPRMFIVVDLPEPFSPTRPSTRPARTSKLTSFSTGTPKKLLSRCSTRSSTSLISASRDHLVAERVGHRREQDDAALDRVDGGERQAEQLQAVVDDTEKQHAEEHADHLAGAAEQAD